MNKLTPIYIEDLEDINLIFDRCNENFKNTIQLRNNRPLIKGKEIFISFNFLEDKKTDLFWHLSSIEHAKLKKQDIFPCNNDITQEICNYNCHYSYEKQKIIINNKPRDKCLYRSVRISWIKIIIELYNNNDCRVKYFEKINSNCKPRVYLRYQDSINDYLIVFEKQSRKGNEVFRLITAYPVFFKSVKIDLDNNYERYVNGIK